MADYAAVKGSTISAVVYTAEPGTVYPRWFSLEVEPGIKKDQYGNIFYMMVFDENDEVKPEIVVPNESVFLRNKAGDIKHISYKLFCEEFVDMGLYAAAHISDCIEYFRWHPDMEPGWAPNWFEDLLWDETVVYVDGDWSFYEDGGEVRLSPECYFIRNTRGMVRYLEVSEFEDNFDVPLTFTTFNYNKADKLAIEHWGRKRRVK